MQAESAAARLRRLARKLRGESDASEFELAGHRFSGMRLLEKLPGRMWSRAGRLSWAATMDGRPVKIIECDSEAQATFLERLTLHPELGDSFPKLHLRRGALAVVDWVEGEELDWPRVWRGPALLGRLAGLQARLHATELEGEAPGYDYRDFLIRRAWRFKSILPLDDALHSITGIIEGQAGPSVPRVSHPDVSAANLVSERETGQIVLIDNELVTQSPYYSIDLFNTARSFGGDRKADETRRYLEAYVQQGGNLQPLLEHAEFFAALWYLRLIGTALQNGDMQGGVRLVDEFVGQGCPTPPLLALAQEIDRS